MNTLINIPFHSKPLCLIDADGKPYAAMRPIVDGMGLAWPPQERKLKARFASTVTILDTVALDGKQRQMLCLPPEKLPAWLLTIHLRKVKAAIRADVERYQAESEAALWSYWTTGNARREDIRREMAELEAEEAASFTRGSHAGKSLYVRKLEKQRNELALSALQSKLPFVFAPMEETA